MADGESASRDRYDCLVLGTAIGDHVGDLQWVLQELGEIAPGTRQSDATYTLANELINRLDDDTSQAKVVCGLPPGVDEAMNAILMARAQGVIARGDLSEIRQAAVRLSDLLGKAVAGED